MALGASWGLPGLSWRFWCKMEGCAKPPCFRVRPGGPLARTLFLVGGALLARGRWPWLGGVLAQRPLGSAPCSLGPGPLGPGALVGPGALAGVVAGAPWFSRKKTQNHEIQQPAYLDPSPASSSRNPAIRGQRAPGRGGPANPEPKTLNHLQRKKITIWGYTLATLKVVWVPGIP